MRTRMMASVLSIVSAALLSAQAPPAQSPPTAATEGAAAAAELARLISTVSFEWTAK